MPHSGYMTPEPRPSYRHRVHREIICRTGAALWWLGGSERVVGTALDAASPVLEVLRARGQSRADVNWVSAGGFSRSVSSGRRTYEFACDLDAEYSRKDDRRVSSR